MGKLYGMKMNAKKTKSMVISRKEKSPRIDIEIDGAKIAQVNKFTYLGQVVTDDGKCELAILNRTGIAKMLSMH